MVKVTLSPLEHERAALPTGSLNRTGEEVQAASGKFGTCVETGEVRSGDFCPDERLAQAAEAAWRGGLRIAEVAGLRVNAISGHGGVLRLDGHSTKGGRPRTVPLDREAQPFFVALRQRGLGHPHGYVFRDRKGLVRELQRWVRRVCQEADIGHSRGHDFRAGTATQRYARLRAGGATDQEARWEVAQALGPGRTDVLKHYLQ